MCRVQKLGAALRARLRALLDRLLDDHDEAVPDLRWRENGK